MYRSIYSIESYKLLKYFIGEMFLSRLESIEVFFSFWHYIATFHIFVLTLMISSLRVKSRRHRNQCMKKERINKQTFKRKKKKDKTFVETINSNKGVAYVHGRTECFHEFIHPHTHTLLYSYSFTRPSLTRRKMWGNVPPCIIHRVMVRLLAVGLKVELQTVVDHKW